MRPWSARHDNWLASEYHEAAWLQPIMQLAQHAGMLQRMMEGLEKQDAIKTTAIREPVAEKALLH